MHNDDEDNFFYYDPGSPADQFCSFVVMLILAGLAYGVLRLLAWWLA